ncbi:MAG TPA: enoyl-CoA hydratase-related protein [Myxococcota bacterium]|nr:enoyl-CoA hydratase-related protein [Myxococcota bacterium]
MPDLLFEKRDGVAWITFNRPAQKNALSPEAVCRLADALRELRDDDALRLGVLTGAGGDMFTSGGDLKRLLPLWTGGRQPADDWDRRVLSDPSVMQTALMKEFALEKPLIAAINGDALAGGFELMLACDLRVAVSHARFGLTEVQRALVPGGGSMVRLARQMPWARAMEILLTGDPIPAETALQLGLVNRLVAPAELVPAVEALASRLARNGPLALRAIKRTALETSGVPLADAFAIEARNSAVVMRSADALEGPRAFAEKRPPIYRGR